ncbi:MAG: 2-C-methyl-D-erythritol 4-phosphate cytidylyltransferase [Xanthomonadales bacterium]|nr:2-C-methyl-D-erythritol 4-phosphate cytidylyltransferase [Xanthomonadales bacterium]MCC6591761.1 2-C-methyl-D-erythritol 4-phosphate cytidylyltransferase [Xanthomonadales bacterium]MCE7930025.1 2-C-methyl-D-erythritol 4-phosphate cytidylyltransferase [Xanthomonadales bacterium PRO6]
MTWVVVPAAGSGRRFGRALPKQYAIIDGRPLLWWTLARLAAVPPVTGLLVVLAPGDPRWPGWAGFAGKPVLTAPGGSERADSVLAGLRALPKAVADTDLVLVHDAARPCVRGEDIVRLLAECGTCGGLLATPVRDTLKRAVDGVVADTVDRRDLWRALTPQCFRRGELIAALEAARAAGRNPTDEAQAIEWSGGRPRLVEGAEDNLKVTTERDLALAAWILKG